MKDAPRLVLAVFLVAAVAAMAWYALREHQRRITVSEATFGRSTLDTAPVAVFRRGEDKEIVYHVQLGAPLQEELSLSCVWTDPKGEVAHRNHWKTKEIDHVPWATHCRCPIDGKSPVGTWRVSLRHARDEVSAGSVEVK